MALPPCSALPLPSHPDLKALGDFIHAQETAPGSGEYMRYGLYSCRGTCQCGTGTYSAPGSHGHEAADVDWMVAAGADYLKIDSSVREEERGNRNRLCAHLATLPRSLSPSPSLAPLPSVLQVLR